MDVLDVSVYWLLPSGETTCCSARHLHKDRRRVGVQLDSQDDYEAMGKALGLKYLGGRCDVTDFLEDLGTLRERRWASLPWEMPKSSMDACWWITNLPVQDGGGVAECDFSVAPKLLCKSLAYLRVELHQTVLRS